MPSSVLRRPAAAVTLGRVDRQGATLVLWALLVAVGVTCLLLRLVPGAPATPEVLERVGAVTVVTAYAFALAARTGGRPLLFGALALLLGVGVLVLDEPYLRAGAAVVTCAVAGVLGVMATVPAVRFLHAARECVVAVLVAAVGALASIGFEPRVAVTRFEYAALALALVGAVLLVHRFGAGLHGLGRRGVIAVVVAVVVLAAMLLYAELLRRYGTTTLIASVLDAVRWSREHLGAFPRPILTVLGVPALVWGTHMRARRPQGWWLCAFGVAATVPVANALVNPATTLVEWALSVLYGLLIGLAIGYAVIRADLALTGSHGARGRRMEERAAVRPEPRRTASLL